MEDHEQVYFKFKSNVSILYGDPVYLKDIIDLSCSHLNKAKIEGMRILPNANRSYHAVSAIDIIKLIMSNIDNTTLHLIGQDKILIKTTKYNYKRNNKIISILFVSFAALLLFIGSGLAIMYFHADVNMHSVHSSLYKFITGQDVKNPLVLSIPYSLGIGIGIALFFDVFTIGKKDRKPGPLELELYKYEKDISDFNMNEEDK